MAAALLLALGTAQAQTYPARSVQMLLGFSAGASVDLMARAVADEMSTILGQRFLVVNREGASGVVAMQAVAAAAPDGYLLGVGPATPITNVPHVQPRLPYKTDSFEYVCQTFRNDFTVAVRADSPYRTLDELLAAARKEPGKLSYGHAGHASIPHLAAVDLLQKAGVTALDVPYKGDAAMNQGPNGIFAPKGTPQEILRRLESACEKAVKSEKVAELAKRYHSAPDYLGSAAFARVVAEDYRRKGELIKTLPLRR